MKAFLLFSFTLLPTFSVIAGQDLVDQVFGEALLNSLSPSLREKLEEVHNTGVFTNKSEAQMAKNVKALLTPEEVTELEAAYRRLILPMLENSLKKQLGRNPQGDLEREVMENLPIELEPRMSSTPNFDDWDDVEEDLGGTSDTAAGDDEITNSPPAKDEF